MKHLIYSILLITLVNNTYAQADVSVAEKENIHNCKLLSSSSSELKNFMTKLKISEDTIILVLLPPMVCPRCEGNINAVSAMIHKQTSIPIYLIVEYNFQDAIVKYLKRRQYQCDKIYVVEEQKFSSMFDFSTKFPQVPYIMKILPQEGEVVFVKALFGDNFNDTFINVLLTSKNVNEYLSTRKNPEIKSESSLNVEVNVSKFKFLNVEKRIKLIPDSSHPLSKVNYIAMNNDDIVLTDYLTLSLFCYKTENDTARFLKTIEPSSSEEKMFVDTSINDEVFNTLKNMGIVNTMFFKPQFVGNNKIAISASLPKVIFNKERTNIDYYNSATILTKQIKDTISDLVFNLNNILPTDSILISHINFYVDEENQKIYLPTQKISFGNYGTSISDSYGGKHDVFENDYYSFFPLFTEFSLDSKFIRYLTCEDTIMRFYKAGYSCINPLVKTSGSSIAYSDGYSGIIHVEKGNIKSKIDIFKVNFTKVNPSPSLDYFQELGQKIFLRRISDILLNNENIYAIVEDANTICLKKFDFEGKLVDESLFLRHDTNQGYAQFAFFYKKYSKNYVGIFYDKSFIIDSYALY